MNPPEHSAARPVTEHMIYTSGQGVHGEGTIYFSGLKHKKTYNKRVRFFSEPKTPTGYDYSTRKKRLRLSTRMVITLLNRAMYDLCANNQKSAGVSPRTGHPRGPSSPSADIIASMEMEINT